MESVHLVPGMVAAAGTAIEVVPRLPLFAAVQGCAARAV